jgi:hypothetical protein
MIAAGLSLMILAEPLAAQRAGGSRSQATQARPRDRAQLEQRVRENFAAEVKKRLQLTDDQMTRMTAVNQQFEAQRRELFQQERSTRIALRTELAKPDESVDQARVSELLDGLLRLQRNRLDIVEREQRELSGFLTPVQRARYQAFADFVQRRLDDLDGPGREGRGNGARGQPGRVIPPGGGVEVGKRPAVPPPLR